MIERHVLKDNDIHYSRQSRSENAMVESRPSLARYLALDDVIRRRRSGIAGAGLSLYARLISHFNITNMVFNYI